MKIGKHLKSGFFFSGELVGKHLPLHLTNKTIQICRISSTL